MVITYFDIIVMVIDCKGIIATINFLIETITYTIIPIIIKIMIKNHLNFNNIIMAIVAFSCTTNYNCYIIIVIIIIDPFNFINFSLYDLQVNIIKGMELLIMDHTIDYTTKICYFILNYRTFLYLIVYI